MSGNVFSFVGTIGRDAEVKYSASGMAILSVNVANNVGYSDKQQTLWIRCTVFGKRAEGKLVDYLKKGQQVFCSGELSPREYTANDGTQKTSLELNANILNLVGKKDSTKPSYPEQDAHSASKANAYQPQTIDSTATKDNFDDWNDDIVF